MPTLEVLGVSQQSDAPSGLLRTELEVDVPEGWDHFALPIAGSVELDAGAPRPRRMEVLCEGGLVHAAALRNDRFDLLASVIGLPAEFELSVVAVLQDHRRIEIGAISARHEPVRSSYEPRLQPLLVTNLGRTGSTFLMRTLAVHEGIVVHGGFPFELWAARYWMHAFQVLTRPRDATRSEDAYGFDRDELHVGPNPFYLPRVAKRAEGALLGRVYAEGLAAAFQAQIEHWYDTVARQQGEGEPRYFAEKHLLRPNGTQPVTWELYPMAREIFLVRDFRDIASSAIDFSEKRGQLMMGWSAGKGAEDYVREDLRASAVEFCDAWERRKGKAHLVRYEDLILQPAQTLAGLLEYLELERSDETIDRLTHQREDKGGMDPVHVTSPSTSASIGRWRREQDTDLRKAIENAFTDLLPQFGYDSLSD